MDQFNFSYFPYTNFNETNLDWIMEHITACGNFWTASQSSMVLDPDQGTGVSFYLNDMTGRPGVPEPQLGDAVFYSEEGITYVAFIDDVVGGGGSNPEFISFRRYRLTGPQGDPGTPGGGGTGLTEEIKEALLQLARKVAYIDADGEDYYQDLYDALYNVEPPASLVSIDAVYTQSGTVYDTDNLYSLEEDLVVTAYYSDGTSAVIPAQDYTLSGTLTVGTSTITVSYGGMTDTFSVTVTENPAPPVTLVSIDAVYTQSGTVYDNDSLNSLKADLVVTATYSDSTTAVIPAADYTLSGTLTAGTSTITASYGGKSDTFTVSVTAYPLPAGYTMYDYVQNTSRGSNSSYVHTGIDYSYVTDDYEHIIEVAVLSGTTTAGGLFGLRERSGSAANAIAVWYKATTGNTDNLAVVAAETDTGYTLTIGSTKSVIKFTHSNGQTIVTLDNTTVISTADKTFTVASGKYISLFGVTTANSATSGFTNATAKFYSYTVRKISTNEIVAQYIPCTNDSNQAGLYDIIGRAFITADGGASNLAAGND